MNPNIIQRTWHAAAEPELTRQLFRINAGEAAKYPHVHAVYLDTAPPEILLGSRSATPIKQRPMFADYLARFNPQGLFDYAYVLDTYELHGIARPDTDLSTVPVWPEFEPLDPCVEEIFAPSHGVLLWNHQLEQLYLLCDSDPTAATQFRKAIQAKKQTAFDQGQNLFITPDLSLTQTIHHRMIYNLTATINLRGAKSLFLPSL